MAANANPLLNSSKFFQLWRKQRYSETFKDSEKKAPMSTSLEHESEQIKLQWKKTKKTNPINNSKMERP